MRQTTPQLIEALTAARHEAARGDHNLASSRHCTGGILMKPIESTADLGRIRSISPGLIYNDFPGRGASGADHNILQHASCYTLAHANLNVPKIRTHTLAEAPAWLNTYRGPKCMNWKRCGMYEATG